MTRDRFLAICAVLSFPTALGSLFSIYLGMSIFAKGTDVADAGLTLFAGIAVLVALVSAFTLVSSGGGLLKRFFMILGAIVLVYEILATFFSLGVEWGFLAELLLSGIPAVALLLLAFGFFETPPNKALQQTGDT